jgi:DNA-binding FadR family transcriptional regulator
MKEVRMALPAVSPRSLVDQAIEAMRAQVHSGEWAVGSRIPSEPALAAELGVGRNTVREAVRALAHNGVLEVRQGDGTYVLAGREVSGLVRKRAADVEVGLVHEVRQAMETQAAVLAASRRTRADLAALRRALRERAAAVAAGDHEVFVEADVAFHVGVVTAAHNALLSELYDGFVPTLRASLAAPQGRDDALCADHDALLAGIADRDPAAAASATGRLLATVAGRLRRP